MTNSADFLVYIAVVSLRSLGLAVLVWLALQAFRVRSASVKHAGWTMVTIAMLAQEDVSFWLPSIPLRVLSPVAIPAPRTDSFAIILPPAPLVRQHASASLSWSAILLLVYGGVALVLLGQFAVGYLFTRRLVRSSKPLVSSTASEVAELRESSWISVPMTVGWLAPKILLPIAWREWEAVKLRAVLAHEEAHVHRADWVIGIVARVNCCLFWFHPLAWWLKRELAVLAEYACDDSALATLHDRQDYAKVLLDMAHAAKSANGRLVWGAIAMAKHNTVEKRIEQILDETRQIPKAFGASRWATLAVCSLPLVYLVSAVQLAPAQSPPRDVPVITQAQIPVSPAAPASPAQVIAQAQTPVLPAPAAKLRRSLESPYVKWLDQEARWIISDTERASFVSLRTDADRKKFIEAFWLQRDPTPDTERNEFKEEHYRRIAYTNDHFTEAVPGWNTDRGMVYIRFGPPDSIDVHGGVPGSSYPYETWGYRYIEGIGTDVQMEFVDTTMTGRYHLTRDPSEKQTRR
jgi:GWxTD domain-containing protein